MSDDSDDRRPSVNIFNETDKLVSAAMWGPMGTEALLAQVYPPSTSLFFSDFNVHKARVEALAFAKTLNKFGCRTFFVRDEVAQNLKPVKMSADELTAKLVKRAAHCPKIQACVEGLIREDIDRYGEKKAVALNYLLTLKPELPLGNLIYARDQMNVLLDKMIVSSMTKPIRKAEVEIYESVYRRKLKTQTIKIPKSERFEGGDAYVHNGFVYMGVGVRSTLGAAKHIFEKLEKKLTELDLEFAIVVDPDPLKRPAKEQMDFMHLDTFSNPIGDAQIAVCEEETKYRRVKFLRCKKGKVEVVDSGLSFIEHLERKEKDIVVIPRGEQESFGCNFLAIDNKTLILPVNSNKITNKRLEAVGKKLIFQDLFESTRGYGAAHCMTGSLRRASFQ